MNESEIRKYLKIVTEDEVFASSPRYVELLTYLVEKSISGEHIKEVTIGTDFFNKSYDEREKSTGGVRVYMFHIRKRLGEYYGGRGCNDRIKFEINKGSYNVHFKRTSGFTKRRLWAVGGISAIAMLVAVLLFSMGRKEELYCWEQIFDGNTPTTIVLADHVTVSCRMDNIQVAIQHPQILNSADYLNYIKTHHCDTLKLNTFPFYSKAIPFAVKDLTKWFSINDKDFSIVSESEFQFKDTKTSNILYVGQSKIMTTSREIFLKNSNVFSVDGNYIYAKRDGRVTKYSPKHIVESVVAEYAIVSYLPLLNGNVALYFVSNNDIGTMATVKRFTNRESLRELFEQLPRDGRYFNALFRVDGVDRNETSCELVDLEIITE